MCKFYFIKQSLKTERCCILYKSTFKYDGGRSSETMALQNTEKFKSADLTNVNIDEHTTVLNCCLSMRLICVSCHLKMSVLSLLARVNLYLRFTRGRELGIAETRKLSALATTLSSGFL